MGDPAADLAMGDAALSLLDPPIVAPKPPGPMDFMVANAVNLSVLQQHQSPLHTIEPLCSFVYAYHNISLPVVFCIANCTSFANNLPSTSSVVTGVDIFTLKPQ